MNSKNSAAHAQDSRRQKADERQLALNCWYLTGATASGKSAVSIELADRINAEIISLDSMAIYRSMDIGTAKPTPAQQSVVPHHLIDIVAPNETFSVSEYRDMSLKKVEEIVGRGKQVLFVGGTALYLKALVRGLFDGPPADPQFRQQIENELADCDSSELMRRLHAVDPLSAHKLHENDRRRIIRALEVYYQTGTPISHWQNEFDNATPAEQCRIFTIRHPRPVLHQRIENRVEAMFENGLVDEVKSLLDQYQTLSPTASQAVGYREVIEFLNGERDYESTRERVLVRTRRFARHQETWFRGLEECRILDLAADWEPAEIAERIMEWADESKASNL